MCSIFFTLLILTLCKFLQQLLRRDDTRQVYFVCYYVFWGLFGGGGRVDFCFVFFFSPHLRIYLTYGVVTPANLNLYLVLMALEPMGIFFCVPHLLLHGTSVYNHYGNLQWPVTLTLVAKRLSVDPFQPVSCVLMTYPVGVATRGSHSDLPHTNCDIAAVF